MYNVHMMYNVHSPRVLIVGGGLVGLSAALFLQHQGVPAMVVERRVATSPQPKARRINIRTMELFRQLGIAEAVLDAARDLADYQRMAAGPTLARARLLPFTLPGGMPDWDTLTPASACLCAQDILEPTLRGIGTGRGCPIRFGVECTDFAADETGVVATLRPVDGAGHKTERLRVDYLIAADGAASPIRRRLGITRSGRGTVGRGANVYFEADLAELVRGREFNLCQIENEDAPGTLASVDGRHRWIFGTAHDIDRPAAQWPAALAAAIGVPGIPIRVRSVSVWEPGMFVADTFRSGRVFLAGDAAHVMPPYAAAGANCGIQDVHNLAWKLAQVLRGAADPALLDSYDTERRPVAYFTADQSSIRTSNLRTTSRTSTDGTPLADPLALILGTRYPAGALVADGSAHTTAHLDLTGQPGTRLPHRFLPDGQSTLDLVGTEPILLIGPAGDAWRAGGESLDVISIDESYCTQVNLTPSGAMLVRPDQIVAWRSPILPADPVATLGAALDRVFGRTAGGSRTRPATTDPAQR
jgi:2-polyprenyl-6-methoxyphenol hydroxylase-like FAD-dependent oxidoreductase